MSAPFVAVVDYGSGNLRSVWQAVEHAAVGTGWQVRVTSDAAHLAEADRQLLGQAFQPAAMIERPLAGKRNDGALAIAVNLEPWRGDGLWHRQSWPIARCGRGWLRASVKALRAQR